VLRIIQRNKQQSFLADIYVACNLAGIFYLLTFSVFERRRLTRLQEQLD
jgi:hypothetical protein